MGHQPPGAPSHAAWAFGVDTGADVPYRDWFLSKVLADGSVSDIDGIYISNGGAGKPAAVGIGYSAGPTGNLLSTQGHGVGRCRRSHAGKPGDSVLKGQTGDMIALGSSKDAYGALRLRSDGTLLAHAAAAANTTGTTGATTSGSRTLIDENATFTPDHVGQFIARGEGSPTAPT